jgi:O-antigen/teichoic acid export membrane protein
MLWLRDMAAALRRAPSTAVFWAMLVPVVRVTGYLAVLTFGLRLLPPSELGLWYVLSTIASLGGAIELGFHHTIARFASYFMAGQRDVRPIGLGDAPAPAGAPCLDRLAGLMDSARSLYRRFGLAAAFNSIVLGGAWLLGSEPPKLQAPHHVAAFLVVGLGTAYNLSQLYWYATLNGVNRVRLYHGLTVLGLALNYAVSIAGLAAGAGIVALAAGFVLMFYAQRFCARREILRMIPPEAARASVPMALRDLWPMTWRVGLVSLSTYVTISASTLVCAQVLDLATAGSFGLGLQLAMILAAFSASWLQVKAPLISQLRAQRRHREIRAICLRRMGLGVLTYGLGAGAALLAAPPLLRLIESQTQLLPPPQFAALLLFVGMEMFLGMHVAVLQTSNRAPHLAPYVASGLLAVSLAVLLGARFGVWGIVLGLLGVQGAGMYWYVPRLCWRGLREADGR